MIRDITLGQYYPKKSVIHELDPRVKLLGTVLFMISLFLFHSFWGFIPVALFFLLVQQLSSVPFSFICKGLKPIILILFMTMGMNLFFTPGKVLFHWGIFRITVEGVYHALFYSVRLIFLVLGSSIMTFTTTPNHLTDGLETMLNPLKKIKFPVHELAMIMSIALRFIPVLLEETDKIMKAQMARGADFEEGNLIQRAKKLVPLLVPLFISAFRRANDLAMAMEARCYRGGSGRTKMKPLRYQKTDGAAYVIMVLYLGIVCVIGYKIK